MYSIAVKMMIGGQKMRTKIHNMILVSLFAALTAVGAFIRIDIPFVPFTMQFFFVLLVLFC